MIRILQIGISNNLGGIESFIINLYRNIDKEKFQFDFIDFSDDSICFSEEIKKMGGKIYKVTPRNKSIRKNKKELKDIIVKNNYKIIHFHLNTLSYITPILIAQKLKGVKIIVHSHNEWKGKNLKTLLLDKINRLRFNKKNITCLACSDVAGKWIFENNKFSIINNGIDLNKFKYSKEKRKKILEELNINDDCTIIGHIGAFRKQKNHIFLIDIFNEYLKLNNNAILVLVGEGNLKCMIQEKIKVLGIKDKVKFLGLRNDTDFIYSAMDYFVFPSLFEGLPIAMIEAQAVGVNCVISDKITKEVILNDNVKVISLEETAKEWANKLYKFSNNSNVKINYEQLNTYSIRTTTNNMEDIYSL